MPRTAGTGDDLVFSAAADSVKQALKGSFVETLRAAEEDLLDVGIGAWGFAAIEREFPSHKLIIGHRSPPTDH